MKVIRSGNMFLQMQIETVLSAKLFLTNVTPIVCSANMTGQHVTLGGRHVLGVVLTVRALEESGAVAVGFFNQVCKGINANTANSLPFIKTLLCLVVEVVSMLPRLVNAETIP
eukprot:TRINITY_DN5041_c0_g2_i1.p1 TRINITY_DN5041_c0_g2~~TRINITY_DN5041_c0_g2_i1.p1  ORF type:complete len:113 (+),score=2.14 TRINITY_DN5041_c0_g2_i1:107-445(+)